MTNFVDPRTGKEVYVRDATQYHRDFAEIRRICLHEDQQPREWTLANGAKSIYQQCQRCGLKRGNALPKGGQYAPANPAIAERYDADIKRRTEEALIRLIDQSVAQDSEWWARYEAYLQTPAWQGRRTKVLARCKGVCEGCGERPVHEVHHLTYAHVTAEFLFELVGLCHACHDRIHADEDAPGS